MMLKDMLNLKVKTLKQSWIKVKIIIQIVKRLPLRMIIEFHT